MHSACSATPQCPKWGQLPAIRGAGARARAYWNVINSDGDPGTRAEKMITIRRCMAADQSAAEQKKDNKYAGETPAPPRGRGRKGE